MTSTIRVKVTRPFCVRGVAFAPGAIVALDPLAAFAAAGKCELVDLNDRAVVKDAVEAANRSALAVERQRGALGGPW